MEPDKLEQSCNLMRFMYTEHTAQYGTDAYRCTVYFALSCCLWCFHLDSPILAFSIVDVSGQIHLVVFFVSPMMTSTSMHRRKAWLHCSATKSKTPKAYQIQCQHHHPYSVNKFMIAPLTGMTSEILCVCVLRAAPARIQHLLCKENMPSFSVCYCEARSTATDV